MRDFLARIQANPNFQALSTNRQAKHLPGLDSGLRRNDELMGLPRAESPRNDVLAKHFADLWLLALHKLRRA